MGVFICSNPKTAMFDHIVLNVVTGLVFIYLLYSLLVTISVEFFSNKLGLRPRLLRFAVERMLNDGYYEKMKKSWFNRVRLYLRNWEKNRILLKKQKEVEALTDDKAKARQEAILKKWEEKGVPDKELTRGIKAIVALITFCEWLYVGWAAWLRRLLLFESAAFKKSFAGKFYEYPSIKYLTKSEASYKRMFSNTKPSYFSGENFGDTVTNMLKEKGVGATDAEKVDFCLTFNPYDIQPLTLKQIRNLWKDAGHDVTTFKAKLKQWFDETMDRTNGWYKQKMQLVSLVVGFIVTVAFNVDTIKITHLLAKDKDARDQLVEMSVRMVNDTTYRHYTNRDAVDSVREQHVDSVYKQIQHDVSAANTVLGLGWDLGNLQQKKKVSVDSTDTDLFKALKAARQSSHYFDSITTEIVTRLEGRQQYRDSIIHIARMLIADSLLIHEDLALITLTQKQAPCKTKLTVLLDSATITDSLHCTRNKINKLLIDIKLTTLWIRRDSLSLQTYHASTIALLENVNTLLHENFVSIVSIKEDTEGRKVSLNIEGMVPWSFWAKAGYWLGRVMHNFWGLFITAVALSFGAPFWFDMLKKIVSLRTAGVKPEEKSPPKDPAAATNIAPVIPPTKPVILPTSIVSSKGKDLVDEALLVHGPDIRAIAGVKSVVAFMQDVDTKTRNLQINVIDALTAAAVKLKYAKFQVNGQDITPVIKITGQPTTHEGPGIIFPKNAPNNAGSIGCIVKQENSDSVHILSCWHVMKDLANRHTVTSIVQDHKGKGLADRWAGGISGAFDYGLARCLASASVKSNTFLKKHLKPGGNRVGIRAVADEDIDRQVTVQYVDFLVDPPVVRKGQIFTDTSSVEVQYADARRSINDVLVITKDVANQTTISQPGNSGSLIFDEKFQAIGMIIAGDNDFTYAVKLSNIFKIHKDLTIL
jgi:hypothetical protein